MGDCPGKQDVAGSQIMWLHGQAVKTPPFHGGNRGSIPRGVTISLCGSGSGVEHRLAKARVASSNLVFRSNLKQVLYLLFLFEIIDYKLICLKFVHYIYL